MNLQVVSLWHTYEEHQFYYVYKGQCETRPLQPAEGLSDLILLVTAPPAAALREPPRSSHSSLPISKMGDQTGQSEAIR